MISLYNINTVARFESKILLRSWFFRIFTLLSLIILGFFDYFLVANKSQMNWTFAALPSFVPYISLMLFNLVQAVIGIFLASDFARRDKNLDTSKVVYARSISNTEYFLGKTLGILYIFLIINALVLIEALIMNVISKLVAIDFLSYLLYPLLISIPTLVFIIGLSFIFMTITRNQAITFILLIGYVALTSFYLGRKLNYMLDFMAYRVPLAQSDFIGFGNLPEVLIHRGIYFFLGIGFIFLSIRFMDRLSQSKNTNPPLILAIIFIGAGSYLSIKYLTAFKKEINLREKAIEANNKYIKKPVVDIEDYKIKINHNKNKIESEVTVIYRNQNNEPLQELIFSLNAGFKIKRIKQRDQQLEYRRESNILIIKPDEAIDPGKRDSIHFIYGGVPEERTSYLDIDTATWREQFNLFFINIDTRYGIVTPDYLLLTKEINWYPFAGAGFSSDQRFNQNIDFANYTLDIKTNPKLVAVSQGEELKSKNGHFIYKSYVPLPQISLTIGPFEKLSVVVDSVEYAIYRKKGHNYWTQHFTELKDTIGNVISELIGDYERKLGLSYPYRKLSLVEVPIQFSCHPRYTTVAWEFSQPEMILLPENGLLLFNADFRQMASGRRFFDREQDLTEKEKQINMLRRGFNSTLASGTTFIRSRTRQGETSNYFSMFPTYYTYVYHINSKEWPIISQAIEAYFNNRLKGQMNVMFRRFGGLSEDEKANIYLQKGSLKYHLENEMNRDRIFNIISIKGDYLFTMLRYNMGKNKFDEILKSFLNENKYSNTEFQQFISSMDNEYDHDINSILNNWYNNKKLPTYAFDQGEYYKIMKDNREMHQIIFKITNYSDIEGFFYVTFEKDRGNRFFFMMDGYGSDSDEEYIYKLEPNQTKEIGIIEEDRTRSYSVNTVISNNLPPTFQRWTQFYQLKEGAVPFEGERIVDEPVTLIKENEIIVDNLDDGFKLVQPKSNKLIKNLMSKEPDDEFEYVNFNWRPEPKWLHFTHTEVYGRTIHSAYYTKPGKGDYKATWTASIPASGKYDVYTYVMGQFVNNRRGRGRDRNIRDASGSFQYTVYHDDGIEKIPLELKGLENGWNFLGTFYFSADSAKVELTNEGEPPMIIVADAMKWVKK